MQIRIRDTVSFSATVLQKQRSSKSDNLRGKQENNLPDRIQVQIGSDVDAVVNDSSDPINIEKESNQKENTFRSETAIFSGF